MLRLYAQALTKEKIAEGFAHLQKICEQDYNVAKIKFKKVHPSSRVTMKGGQWDILHDAKTNTTMVNPTLCIHDQREAIKKAKAEPTFFDKRLAKIDNENEKVLEKLKLRAVEEINKRERNFDDVTDLKEQLLRDELKKKVGALYNKKLDPQFLEKIKNQAQVNVNTFLAEVQKSNDQKLVTAFHESQKQ